MFYEEFYKKKENGIYWHGDLSEVVALKFTQADIVQFMIDYLSDETSYKEYQYLCRVSLEYVHCEFIAYRFFFAAHWDEIKSAIGIKMFGKNTLYLSCLSREEALEVLYNVKKYFDEKYPPKIFN